MRPRRCFTYLLPVAILVLVAVGMRSNQDEIKRRQQELQNIRDQIQEFETRIKEQQAQEQETLDLLDTYDRKGTLLRQLIGKLHAAEKDLQNSIEKTKIESGKLEQQLQFLRAHYANYVSSVYKYGRDYDIELLLSSKSINQFYVRTEYLKRFSLQRKKDVDKILSKKTEIEESQARLQRQLAEQRRLISDKGAEEDRLAGLMDERKEILSHIRKDKSNAQKEMERQRRAAKDLENIIANLIEAERIRKEREAEEARKSNLPQPVAPVGTFEMKKGKLPWPVGQGTVVAKFGNQVHPTLKTVTQNTGIDISVKSGSPVTAVAEGEVSTIWWLPSYGNLVIVNHYNGYRTVYAHLSEIDVTEGQKLKEGDNIGTSGESLDGPRLHFELWKEREKQNPELWLSK
jgi:septal ring factor EnvC (AmiA/AmiB activator)